MNDSAVLNTKAASHCVSALKTDSSDYLEVISYAEGESDSTLRWVLSTRGLIQECHKSQSKGSSDFSDTVYVDTGNGLIELANPSTDAMGYISADETVQVDVDNSSNLEADSQIHNFDFETRILTIPEMKRPEFVVDVPPPIPRTVTDASITPPSED